MTYYVAGLPYSANDIYHHGVKGQKWGIRRYQNPDGTLTPEGKARYGTVENFNRQYKGASSGGSKVSSSDSSGRKSKLKTALKVGAVVAGTALLAYGGYRLSKAIGKSDFSNKADQGQSVISEMLKNNLNELNSGVKESSSKAKGAASQLNRMSDQLRSSVPKPPSSSSSSRSSASSSSKPKSSPYSFNTSFNARDALKNQYSRMSDRSESRNARDAMSELERLNRELKRSRR